jgi:hypothetical protein
MPLDAAWDEFAIKDLGLMLGVKNAGIKGLDFDGMMCDNSHNERQSITIADFGHASTSDRRERHVVQELGAGNRGDPRQQHAIRSGGSIASARQG